MRDHTRFPQNKMEARWTPSNGTIVFMVGLFLGYHESSGEYAPHLRRLVEILAPHGRRGLLAARPVFRVSQNNGFFRVHIVRFFYECIERGPPFLTNARVARIGLVFLDTMAAIMVCIPKP